METVRIHSSRRCQFSFKGQKLSAKLLQALEVVALEQGIVDLRIDTYKANIGMQKNIQAAGYQYKGE